MLKKTIKLDTNPYDDRKLFGRKTVEFNPGITVLVGCNGAGKTTVFNYIEDALRKENIPFLRYDNVRDGGIRVADKAMFNSNMELAASVMVSSEGERISLAVGQFIGETGAFVKRNRGAKELWLLFDAMDSGWSIDNIEETKDFFKDVLLHDTRNQDVYIVISGNQYAVAEGEDCIDVQTSKHIRFKSYDDYRKYVLDSRNKKDRSIEKVG